jgi:hypothetical protein
MDVNLDPSRWVTFEKGMKNPDFILSASGIGTSASVGIYVRAKVNYYKKGSHNQVVIEKEKENARTDGPRIPPIKLVTQPDPDLHLQSENLQMLKGRTDSYPTSRQMVGFSSFRFSASTSKASRRRNVSSVNSGRFINSPWIPAGTTTHLQAHKLAHNL